MKGHDIEVWSAGGDSSVSGKSSQKHSDEFALNKFGRIMKSAGAETLNCMKLAHYLP